MLYEKARIRRGGKMEGIERYFTIDDQWCVLHLPEKPNGFGVLVIGDVNHYVDEDTALWTQHTERQRMLATLLDEGYTVFYSHLYGRNWGSPDAVELAKQLVSVVMRKETLNEKVHLLAEGMGGLTAVRMIEDVPEYVRSAAMINPCLDLHAHLKKEQETRLFYKRLSHEIADAYHVSNDKVEETVSRAPGLEKNRSTVPSKIWHATNRTSYGADEHSRPYEQIKQKAKAPITLTFHLPEKQFSFGKAVSSFFRQYEHRL